MLSFGPELGLKSTHLSITDIDWGDRDQLKLEAHKVQFTPQVGAFVSLRIGKMGLSFRPSYGHEKSTLEIAGDSANSYPELKLESVDLPLLFNLQLIGPLEAFGGINFHYLLSSSTFDPNTRIWSTYKEQKLASNMDLQVGVGLNFRPWIISLGYQDNLGLSPIELPISNYRFQLETKRSNLFIRVAYNLRSNVSGKGGSKKKLPVEPGANQ